MQFLLIVLSIIGIVLGLLILFVIMVYISDAFVDGNRIYKDLNPFYVFQLNTILWLIMIGCRIRVHGEGLEQLPKGPFLLVGNHRSSFDPLCNAFLLRKIPLSFISKESNLHLTMVGKLSRRCCYLPIDRQSPREALKTIDDAAELISGGTCSVGVYPEGTRSKDGQLLPFHSGVLKIAQKANVPIVVMVVTGTENIQKNIPWRTTDVTLRLTKVYSADYVKSQRSSALGNEIYAHIASVLGQETH